MLINEICKRCGLTKKAVEYYIEQGLISPAVMENGYRDFSREDAERLRKISILRKLGLAVTDIRRIFSDHGGMALYRVSQRKDLEIEDLKLRRELIAKLARDDNWEYARTQLEVLEKKKTILQKMLDRFPGAFGKYIVYHFAPYLNEPVTTDEQQEAFEIIVDFLDSVEFTIPEDLREYLDEATKSLDWNLLEEITADLQKAVRDPERYIAANREALSGYVLLKETEFFKQSPAYRLRKLLESLFEENGYYDVFLPAMRRLSNTYREYHAALEKADQVFRKVMAN